MTIVSRLLFLLVACALPPSRARADETLGVRLVDAARTQIGVTIGYDSRYQRIAYPGGDVAPERGVCTDVLVRAYRVLGIDLQQRVHEDMQRAWSAYPKIWGLSRPDSNIDHRRVPNLATFFARHGTKLPVTDDPSDYEVGDIVTWRLASGVPHIGLVSGGSVARRRVVHNIGAGTHEEAVLFDYTITGHYRYAPAR